MKKVWVNSYQADVPEEIDPDRYGSLVEFFDESCQKFSNQAAYTNLGTALLYSEVYTQVCAFASFLRNELKCEQGERFAIMLPNVLQYPVAMFGILKAGLVVVNVNPLYTADELQAQLKDSQAIGIIVLENFAYKLDQIIAETNIKHTIITRLGDMCPWFKSWLVHLVVKYIKKMIPKWELENYYTFNQVLIQGRGLACDFPNVQGSDIAYLQYTGGTTGVAKGAVLTHRNMVANVEQASVWIKSKIKLKQEIIITALPLYHIFSLLANCLIYFGYGALNVLITNPRDMSSFIKDLKKFKFTAITGVNTLYNALVNNSEFSRLDFSDLRIVLGGGMAVQRTVAERWKKITGVNLLEAYGLTETSPAACINPMHLDEFNGCIGLPIPSTEISIRDADDQELSFDEVGELWIRGPQVMREYWQNLEETNNVLTSDGWLRTGDIAKISSNGFIKIVDRKKDMIIVSGFNVYPNEIEDIISQLKGVLEVAVIGIPDESRGELVKAFVVKKKQNLTENEILEHCRKHLTAYKIPKQIEFRKELPKTNVGKILRRALR